MSHDDLGDFLIDGEFFVPQSLGLLPLQFWPPNKDDNYLHTLEAFEVTREGTPLCDAAELVNRFKMANEGGWLSKFIE